MTEAEDSLLPATRCRVSEWPRPSPGNLSRPTSSPPACLEGPHDG